MLGDVITNSANVVAKGRLGPGQMVVADLTSAKFYANADVSKAVGAGLSFPPNALSGDQEPGWSGRVTEVAK